MSDELHGQQADHAKPMSAAEAALMDAIAMQVMPIAVQLFAKQEPTLAGAQPKVHFGLAEAAQFSLEAGRAYIAVRRAATQPAPQTAAPKIIN